MSDSIQLTTHELWVEGRALNITATKLNPTTLRLSWDLPTAPQAYDGAVVLLSESRFSSVHFPVDGTRYAPSSNWAAPADTINSAQVVASFYGFFGDSITTQTVDVSNIDPTKLYYASIHAASNVLQYYTVGCQSYPLESSRFEKQSETYAGSIPTGVVPPSNPFNGQTYFDPLTNIVQVWNDSMGAWVQGNQSTVPVGDLLPIVKNQIFYNTISEQLKYFNGASWVICDSTNTQVKMGAAWAPFNSVSMVSTYPTAPAVGDFIYIAQSQAMAAPAQYSLKLFSLGSWFAPTVDLIRVQDPIGTWINIQAAGSVAGSFDIPIPSVGDFFYQQSTRDLMVWNGNDWVKADTDNEGAPTTDKIGVGTDGSYDERLRLIKVLKHQLGWPGVCVELTEEQFNVAIDNSLDEFRRRADNAYLHRHVAYTLVQNQSNYYLNDPRDKTDKIVNVLKIHRVGTLGISSISAENGIYAQAFFNQLYQGSNVDVLSIHLMAQLAETYEKIFAGNLVFTWDEASRQLMILRKISAAQERVILEVVMERTEQELLLDRWAKQWLQGWAQSELWEMLGMLRSKYGNLPGPNGGITMNGDTLLSMATEQQNELLRQITDYEAGNGGVNFGNTAFYIG
jgi:hypothetical protein